MPNDAINEFQSALKLRPDNPGYQTNLGVAYLQKTDFDAASDNLSPRSRQRHRTQLFITIWGSRLNYKDKLPEATAEFRNAEQTRSAAGGRPLHVGRYLLAARRFSGGRRRIADNRSGKPDYAEAYYTLGTVLKQQGKLQDSATALREAIRLQPDFAGAHTTLAAVLRQLGDNDGAASETKAGIEIGKEKTNQQAALFATNSGKRLFNAGDLDGAISQFRSAITAAPNYAPAHYQLRFVAEKRRERRSAKEFQRRRSSILN